MRKPKIHDKYGIILRGVNFKERWNIVKHATKSEILSYIENENNIRVKKNKTYQDNPNKS